MSEGREETGVNGGMKKLVGRWPKREELLRNGFREEIGLPKVYITTGIPTRVVGTCFCGENLGSASNLSICFNFKLFSFVMTCNNKKYGAIFGCHITFCAITQYI